MPASMTAQERAIRSDLFTTTRTIRSALQRCPAVTELDRFDEDAIRSNVREGSDALLRAVALADQLEALEDATDEAMLVVATSRIGLAVVREALTAIEAALDMRADVA